MSTGFLLLNAAYVVYAAASALKEILYLRIMLLVASFLYIAYGLVEPVTSVFVWNIPVVVLHLHAIWQLVKDRRGIDLDDEAEGIRRLLFDDLDRVAFNQLWHTGKERVVADQTILIRKGEPVQELSLILDGEVNVDVRPGVSLRLGHFRILGELSTLTGSTATATVNAHGDVRLRAWDKQAITRIGTKMPEIERAMLRAMGTEAARKVL